MLFLLVSSLGALTQWKALLHTLCRSDSSLAHRPTLYLLLLPALTAQLKLAPEVRRGLGCTACAARVPRVCTVSALYPHCMRTVCTPRAQDFFVDELSGDNFLRAALAALADAADATGAALHAPLAAELGRLWAFLTARFGLDVGQLRREQLEDEDEAPVLVLGTEAEAEALGASTGS